MTVSENEYNRDIQKQKKKAILCPLRRGFPQAAIRLFTAESNLKI